MEAASLGVILDSSVVIEAERQHLNVAQFLKQIIQRIGATETALGAITVAELAHGIYRADTSERRVRRRVFLDELKAVVPVYPITDGAAELAGKIGAESSTAGVTIPATRNPRHFKKSPRSGPDLALAVWPAEESPRRPPSGGGSRSVLSPVAHGLSWTEGRAA
jgi:predicted nucleic acid-binding protein